MTRRYGRATAMDATQRRRARRECNWRQSGGSRAAAWRPSLVVQMVEVKLDGPIERSGSRKEIRDAAGAHEGFSQRVRRGRQVRRVSDARNGVRSWPGAAQRQMKEGLQCSPRGRLNEDGRALHRRAEAGPREADRARQLRSEDTQSAGSGGWTVWKCVRQSGWGGRRGGSSVEEGRGDGEGSARAQRVSQLLLAQTPRTKPPARGKSFNQGFVYLSGRLVAASRT